MKFITTVPRRVWRVFLAWRKRREDLELLRRAPYHTRRDLGIHDR